MDATKPRCLAFGEAMLRLRAAHGQRLPDVMNLEVGVGGAELNAMIAASIVGVDARFLTRLPTGPLGERVIRHGRQHDVMVLGPREQEGRLGTYYVEAGNAPRGVEIFYDRTGSSFAGLTPDHLEPASLLEGVDHLHLTGISFALGAGPARAAELLLESARERDVTVSYDINYRSRLWSFERAERSVHSTMRHVTTLFASPHDLQSFFGCDGPIIAAAEEVRERFGLDRVVVSEREEIGSGSTRSRVTILGKDVGQSDWIEAQALDPIGAGDAVAGVALGELLMGSTVEVAAERAAAAAALQQTLLGDALVATRDDLALSGVGRQVRR